jgi:hypothetical protein
MTLDFLCNGQYLNLIFDVTSYDFHDHVTSANVVITIYKGRLSLFGPWPALCLLRDVQASEAFQIFPCLCFYTNARTTWYLLTDEINLYTAWST